MRINYQIEMKGTSISWFGKIQASFTDLNLKGSRLGTNRVGISIIKKTGPLLFIYPV
jgi:hypothetical protein